MPHIEHPLAEDPCNFASLPSIEYPDWAYARNQRCVLMAPSAEWIQSVYSCRFELGGKQFVAPNRDYPYEGLLVYQDGENWKFIDCVALALQYQDGKNIPFIADDARPTVQANPWKVTYGYRVLDTDLESGKKRELPFYVSYYLNSDNTPKLVTGCVEFYFPEGLVCGGGGIIPTIQPFVDIRHMYGGSSFSSYSVWEGYKGNYKQIHISNSNRTLTFYLPHVEAALFGAPQMLPGGVWYKLGTGSRVERLNPATRATETVFSGEGKDVASFFNLSVPFYYGQNFIRLFWGCGLGGEPAKYFWPSMERMFKKSRDKDRQQFQQLQEAFPLPEHLDFRPAILARIAGLVKFKIYIQLPGTQDYIQSPHAGAWWFKTPWFRDVFEGIFNSFETLMQLGAERDIVKKIILLALREQDKTSGRILNRIPEFKHLERSYENSDGTLLCFVVANAYIQKTRDVEFALAVLPHAVRAVTCFQSSPAGDGQTLRVDGPPRIDGETGLLLSVPHHSWIDTRSQRVDYNDRHVEHLPNRVSKQFVRDLCDQMANKNQLRDVLFSPKFFLPEINAQWITMLRGTLETIDFVTSQGAWPGELDADSLRENIRAVLSRAEQNFGRVFWNDANGFLFNVVYEDGTVKDAVECEAGVAAAAMLGATVFTPSELEAIWSCARDRLLVKRRLVKYGHETWPFGIITKNEGQHVYYGDDQYHSDVVWLRSTPYLIKLLRLLNQTQTIKEVLINTLDHQMTEGAIFYNQELLARPLGQNPHPDKYTSQNPVPVKNPIQFWSQWCDAFIEFFGDRENGHR